MPTVLLEPNNKTVPLKDLAALLRIIWRCMTAYGVGFMYKVIGTMDQHLYKSILEDELLHTTKFYNLNPSQVIFQQDNDSKHKTASVQTWPRNQEFDVLEWPAQSPDLNLIEHLWAILKKKLNQYDRPPNGMLELWERIKVE
jgi:DDE superfamily endonuclease